ncbi:hypothetical protein J4E93_001125 [Alternaria ventricosa]|uniref:uncharacterized protein n=1 Tax=Alternaria ventricosa TaxID=1187951 RepID=UPI0020C2069E|nr:uncharacterized protein J4E93_001125 [Alternaria ventricosa]KAI4653359.1 hypothetical protein J4E93_001125 [Alternaria ventricosa]
MPRSTLVVASAVLALLSPLAQAKIKSEIRTYLFTSDDCNGPTIGGNEDLKPNKCHDIVSGANSMRPSTNKHQDWLNQINLGQQECWVATYKHHGCAGYPSIAEGLPGAIDQCLSPPEQFLSMMFGCRDAKSENFTTTVVVTPPTIVTVAPQPISTSYITVVEQPASTTITVIEQPATTTITVIEQAKDTITVYQQPNNTITVYPQPITTSTVVTEVGIVGYLTTWMHAGSSFTNYVSTILTTSTKTLYSTKRTVPTSMVTIMPTSIETITPIETGTVLPSSRPHTVTAYVEDSHYPRERRSDPQPEAHALEPRRRSKWKGPRIGVWMKHPWSQAVICYECYAKAHDNLWKFECRSGPNNPVSCEGPVPDPNETVTITHTPDVTVTQGAAITSMSVVTVTAGHAITTVVGGNPIQPMQTITLGQKEADLERRSFHRAVRLTHPWYPNTEMCADAEWEERGSKGSEVRIQKPKEDMKKCTPKQQVQFIDANPETKTIELPYSTVSVIFSTSTVYPPAIVTVAPPSVVTVIGSQPVVTITTISAPPMVTVTTITAPPLVTVTHKFPPAAVTTTIIAAPEPPCTTEPYSITTVYVDPEPPCTTTPAPVFIKTVTVAPEPPCTTTPAPVFIKTVFVDPEPPCDTVTVAPEPPCDTVTVVGRSAPTPYTTFYSKRQQLRDL